MINIAVQTQMDSTPESNTSLPGVVTGLKISVMLCTSVLLDNAMPVPVSRTNRYRAIINVTLRPLDSIRLSLYLIQAKFKLIAPGLAGSRSIFPLNLNRFLILERSLSL